MDSLVTIAGKEISPKDAEFGIQDYKFYQLTRKYEVRFLMILQFELYNL
tara:strand:+ start:442 stop:588 length:147 start_codon:yes stop_codon:yes gene_type:complete